MITWDPGDAMRASVVLTIALVMTTAFPASGMPDDGPSLRRLLDIEIGLPTGDSPTITIGLGSPVKISHRDGTTFGFVPMQGEDDSIVWYPFYLSSNNDGKPLLRFDEPRRTEPRLLEFFMSPVGEVYVQILRVDHSEPSVEIPSRFRPYAIGHLFDFNQSIDECCVSCDDWTVCGASVCLWCDCCP